MAANMAFIHVPQMQHRLSGRHIVHVKQDILVVAEPQTQMVQIVPWLHLGK
jgi:hypothetical protein